MYVKGCGQRLCKCYMLFYTRDLHILKFGYLGIMGPNPAQMSRENSILPHMYSGCYPYNPDDDPAYQGVHIRFIDRVTGAQRSRCLLFRALLSLFSDIATCYSMFYKLLALLTRLPNRQWGPFWSLKGGSKRGGASLVPLEKFCISFWWLSSSQEEIGASCRCVCVHVRVYVCVKGEEGKKYITYL